MSEGFMCGSAAAFLAPKGPNSPVAANDWTDRTYQQDWLELGPTAFFEYFVAHLHSFAVLFFSHDCGFD